MRSVRQIETQCGATGGEKDGFLLSALSYLLASLFDADDVVSSWW